MKQKSKMKKNWKPCAATIEKQFCWEKNGEPKKLEPVTGNRKLIRKWWRKKFTSLILNTTYVPLRCTEVTYLSPRMQMACSLDEDNKKSTTQLH